MSIAFGVRYARLLLASVSFLIVFAVSWLALAAVLVGRSLPDGVASEQAASSYAMNYGIVLFVSPFVWVCHALALMWWARVDSEGSWRSRVARCAVSALLTVVLFAILFSAVGIREDAAYLVFPFIPVGMVLSVLAATTAAFHSYGKSPSPTKNHERRA